MANLNRPADSFFCHWPTCDVLVIDYPLCWHHALKVYSYVQSSIEPVHDALLHPEPHKDARHGWVYFVRYRDRVKIGYSIQPKARIQQHPVDEVLAIVPGEPIDEKRAHAAFAHLRENGEWFRAEPELLDFARSIAA